MHIIMLHHGHLWRRSGHLGWHKTTTISKGECSICVAPTALLDLSKFSGDPFGGKEEFAVGSLLIVLQDLLEVVQHLINVVFHSDFLLANPYDLLNPADQEPDLHEAHNSIYSAHTYCSPLTNLRDQVQKVRPKTYRT